MTSFSLLAMESRLHGIPCFFAIIHVLPMSSLPSLRLSNPLIWPLCLNKKLAMKEDLTADIAYQFVTKNTWGESPFLIACQPRNVKKALPKWRDFRCGSLPCKNAIGHCKSIGRSSTDKPHLFMCGKRSKTTPCIIHIPGQLAYKCQFLIWMFSPKAYIPNLTVRYSASDWFLLGTNVQKVFTSNMTQNVYTSSLKRTKSGTL